MFIWLILIFLHLQNILFHEGTSPVMNSKVSAPLKHQNPCNLGNSAPIPQFFLSHVQKNIPEFSVYSEYFISWGDRRYIFYKVVESTSHIKNLKRLTSLMGLKEGRHSKVFSFSHFWSLSGYLSFRSFGYPQFPFLLCRDRNKVSMVVRAISPWSQDPHLSF